MQCQSINLLMKWINHGGLIFLNSSKSFATAEQTAVLREIESIVESCHSILIQPQAAKNVSDISCSNATVIILT